MQIRKATLLSTLNELCARGLVTHGRGRGARPTTPPSTRPVPIPPTPGPRHPRGEGGQLGLGYGGPAPNPHARNG
jgi:hypothetical protein